MQSAEKHLFQKYGPLLLTPAYSVTDPTVGYITRYAPSVRENGGLYTHAGTWAIQAVCMQGEGNLAHKVYRSFSPPLRGLDPDHYYAEPYVTPGNVDGPDSPNFGRGGWTWYTGSAAWLYKVALDWILGVRASLGGLVIDPCIPKEWSGFKVRRIFRDATYMIEILNPKHVEKGVKEIIVDGVKISGNMIKPHKDHLEHTVKVVMG
jgi:cellobiose phosphorylase